MGSLICRSRASCAPVARILTALLAVTVLLAPISVDAVAQDRSSDDAEGTYTMAWRGTSLEVALQELIARTDIDLAWDPLLVTGKQTFCVANSQPPAAILRCVLRGTGLDYVQRSSGLYVLEIAAQGVPLYGNLRGIVLDAETEQPVSHAHVYLAEADRGGVANAEGMFIFPRLLPGRYTMQVSHMGYREHRREITVDPGSDASTEVNLESTVIALTTPLIVDGIASMPSSTLLGAASASQDEVLSELRSGSTGFLQGLDAMPGVRVNDATADIHIQGGEAGEHQFRLDGAPVFLPLNVASFIGPFSPFALGKITVNKAGFGVPLGSQISGVISAEHDLRAPAGSAGLSGSRYTLQVDPLSTNARYSSYWTGSGGLHATTMAALRVGTWSLLAPPSLAGLLDDWNAVDTFLLSAFAERNTPFANLPPVGEPAIQFVDVHQATRLRFGPLRTLHVSGYFGRNSLGNDLSGQEIRDPSGDGSPIDQLSGFTDLYTWKTGMMQARYDLVHGAHTLTHAQIRASYYDVDHNFESPDLNFEGAPQDDDNRVYEVASSVGLDYFSSSGHHVETGFEAVVTGSRFRVSGTQQLPLFHRSVGFRTAAFVQDRFQIGRHTAMEAGSRFTWLNSNQTLYVEPRLAFRFDWTETPVGGMSLYLASGLYRQFVNQFDVSSRSPRTFVSSTRFWMSNDETVSPPKAAHFAAEWLIMPSPRWQITLESYYKKQYHILAIDYSADPGGIDPIAPGADTATPSAAQPTSASVPQTDFLQASNGYSAGVGARIRRTIGRGHLSARVERTESRREITNLYRGERLTVPWSEPLRLELAADISPFNGAVLIARWKSVWDRPWGYRKAYYDFLSAHLNNLDALLEEMRANGVSADAIRRVERQITHYDLTRPDTHVLGAIHQLDLSASYATTIGRAGVQFRADVVNVLNRDNTAEWRFELDEDSYFGGAGGATGLLERSNRLLLPRVVSFAVRVTL